MVRGFVLGMGFKVRFHLTGLSNPWVFRSVFIFIHYNALYFLAKTLKVRFGSYDL